jgi:hypothetical protein
LCAPRCGQVGGACDWSGCLEWVLAGLDESPPPDGVCFLACRGWRLFDSSVCSGVSAANTSLRHLRGAEVKAHAVQGEALGGQSCVYVRASAAQAQTGCAGQWCYPRGCYCEQGCGCTCSPRRTASAHCLFCNEAEPIEWVRGVDSPIGPGGGAVAIGPWRKFEALPLPAG